MSSATTASKTPFVAHERAETGAGPSDGFRRQENMSAQPGNDLQRSYAYTVSGESAHSKGWYGNMSMPG